ncbi:MAG: 50S ribosomal protein L21 [Chlamydiia bacterium]|nr:50S ribosomal protein L21 [Chlamydiia bacterium]
MYAIIQTGGKQYRVEENEEIDVELLPGNQGDSVTFEEVLFIGNEQANEVGSPYVNGYVVNAEIVGMAAGPKVTSMKYKKRKRQQTKFGHRQKYSRVKITQIAKQGGA